MLVDGALYGQHKVFFGYRQASADHYEFGVEDVYQPGYRAAQRAAYLLERLDGQHVFFREGIEDVIEGYLFP